MKTSLSQDTHKISHAPGPRAKAIISQEPGPDLLAGLGGSPGEVGAVVAHPGDTDIAGRHIREYSSV